MTTGYQTRLRKLVTDANSAKVGTWLADLVFLGVICKNVRKIRETVSRNAPKIC